MKYLFILWMVCIGTQINAQHSNKLRLKSGHWSSRLQLTDTDYLPFDLTIDKQGTSYTFTIHNGTEAIKMETPLILGDTISVGFPMFNSRLVFTTSSKKSIQGYWLNLNKGPHYKIPFSAVYSKNAIRFSHINPKQPDFININGKWDVAFQAHTENEYPAVGVFKQADDSYVVNGTFMTETGDYRFLSGNTTKDSMYLSCFDGSHAFLFKAGINNGILNGTFFSGNHWSTNWEAKANEDAALTSPDALTYIKEGESFQFTFKDVNGVSFSFPEQKQEDKVYIVQLMGTWCPNCIDETFYYKELYNKYHSQGLEIISICYELGKDSTKQLAQIKRFQQKLDVDFKLLFGGDANKSLASEQFDMLNKIISFPTSIYVGKDGEVKRIHTGFNGPGTGEVYKEYVKETTMLVEYLLAQ